ncbi:MAG: hypothetical protein WD534_18095 [Phycisphaeraceae bacterium]
MFAAKVLVGFAVLVTVVVGWRWGDQWLRDYAAERHGEAVTAEHVVLGDTGRIPALAVEQLQQFVAEQVSADPLDGESLRYAALELEQHPLVRRLHQVRRVAGGQVIVEATYRQPTAMIESDGVFNVVDAEGVRLPLLYLPHRAESLDLPLIVGVGANASPVGEVWPGRDVQAGLALVQMLRDEPFAEQIRAYDVSQSDGRGRLRLVLHTTTGGLVRWGLPPGQEQTVEPEAMTKIHWLRHVDDRRGSIDAGGKVVDVYGAGPQISQPSLTDEPASAYTSG